MSFQQKAPCSTVECAHRATYGPTPGYWDMDCVKKILCKKDPALVKELNKLNKLKTFEEVYWDDPYYDGTKWTTKRFPGGGFNQKSSKEIGLVTQGSCEDGAVTVKHELVHQSQPKAYYKAEEWAIKHGLPSQAPSGYNFRKTVNVGPGKVPMVKPDKAEIQRMVRDAYPVPPAKSGPPPPQVIGRNPANGYSIVEDPTTGKLTQRPPKKGDSYPGPMTTRGEQTIKHGSLSCP